MVVNAKAWDEVEKKMYDAIISDIHDWCVILDGKGGRVFGRPVLIDDAVMAGFSIYPG